MASLLGQFFNKIKGSQEDIATESLVYILQKSANAREALFNYINIYTGLHFSNLNFSSQIVGENLERPDISGINQNGEEMLIIEAKFWASLTQNQPVEYLNRLNKDTVLLFLCPKLRKTTLNNEIENRLNNQNINYKYSTDKYILDANKIIYICDWATILDNVKASLQKNNENILVSDIDQIIGFCEVIDNYSFLPILDNDLSPAIAKRLNSYSDLVDKILDKLRTKIDVNLSGMKATPQKYGYSRYFIINKFAFRLDVDLKLWELIADTPFWLTIKQIENEKWIELGNENKLKINEIAHKANIKVYKNPNYENNTCFALTPLLNEVEEAVIEDIVNKIINIVKNL